MAALSLYEIKIDNNNDAVEDAIKRAAALKMPARYCSWGLLARTECWAASCLFRISPKLLLVSAVRIHRNCSARPDATDLHNHFFVLRAVVMDLPWRVNRKSAHADRDEEVIVQISGIGPSGTIPVNPDGTDKK